MNTIFDSLAASSAIELLGWTLIHFVWQAMVVAAIVYCLLCACRRSSANFRYLICCAGMLVMIVCPVVTLSFLNRSNIEKIATSTKSLSTQQASFRNIGNVDSLDERGPTVEAKNENTFQAPQDLIGSSLWFSNFNQSMNRWMPLFVVIWITGVGLHLIRLCVGVICVHRWRADAKPVSNFELNNLFSNLERRIGVRKSIRLLQTSKLNVSAVAGVWRPVVLMPASMMTGLSIRELEMVLAHELAHVKRYDYLVNIAQKTAEAFFFFHPAVWWISNRIRVEREYCCDDIAVDICGDRLALAKALAAMESIRCGGQQIALAANGGSLGQRVRRLLLQENEPAYSIWPSGVLVLAVVGFSFLMPITAFVAEPKPDLERPELVTAHPTATKSSDREIVETKKEIRKKDSRTNIEQRVFTGIQLSTKQGKQKFEATVDMKYSNVIPYSFIPERIAKSLHATKLGEIDFAQHKSTKTPIDVTWNFIPNDFANPTGYVKGGVQNTFVDFVREPSENQNIVPYPSNSPWTPDHLGFYEMNQEKQTRFDVVRIEQVDLGIGKPFGPVNALVLKDENSEFGLFGSKWASKVRGRNGSTLWHAAVGEFQMRSRTKRKKKNGNSEPRVETKPGKKQANSSRFDQDKPLSIPHRPGLPEFEVAHEGGDRQHLFVRSINVRRSPADLLKHFANIFQQHGTPRKGLSITNMESIVSAYPSSRKENLLEADEVVFSLPEGSRSRAALIGVQVELDLVDDAYRILITDGKVQWIDSVGVIRAEAATRPESPQLEVTASIDNDEIVMKIKAVGRKTDDGKGVVPVRVKMNLATGAPKDEEQPPHGGIRYEIFEVDKDGDKPMRLKMKWRYDLDRLAKEAEKQTGKTWEEIIND